MNMSYKQLISKANLTADAVYVCIYFLVHIRIYDYSESDQQFTLPVNAVIKTVPANSEPAAMQLSEAVFQ